MIASQKRNSGYKILPIGLTLLLTLSISGAYPASDPDIDTSDTHCAESISTIDYETYLDSADKFIKATRWEDAAKATRDALKLRPGSPLNTRLFSNLGICLMHTGDYEGATEAFTLSLIRDSLNASVLASRASAYMLLDKRTEALEDAVKAIDVDSVLPIALRIHGQLSLLDHDITTARRDFNKLCDADSTEVWGPAGLARCLILEEKYNDAIPLLYKAISIGDDESLRISLIESLIQSNKLGEAEEAIRDALSHFPSAGHLYLLRGVLHKKFYQNSEAEIDKKIAREYGVDSQIIEQYLPDLSK